MFERDPVSVLWDSAAAALLERARKARGEWQGTRIADPSQRQREALLRLGIDVLGRDVPSAAGGRARGGAGLDCKTRWARGFARAVWYANDRGHGGPGLSLELEVGAHKPPLGVIPAGRAVRLRVRRGGMVSRRIVRRLPDDRRIYDDSGRAAARWSDPRLRDW